jgi:hypothetical protein
MSHSQWSFPDRGHKVTIAIAGVPNLCKARLGALPSSRSVGALEKEARDMPNRNESLPAGGIESVKTGA